MDNIYVKKLLSLRGFGIIIAFIILSSSNMYLKSYIMNYFMFNNLDQMINIGPFSIQLSWIIGIIIAILMVSIHTQIFNRMLTETSFTKLF